jgi:serine/threonine-protein kinase HipA
MADELDVWLRGRRVALVSRQRDRLDLTYTEAALAEHQLGTPLLSLSLPLVPQRYTKGRVWPFLDGLLPEGAPRRVAAEDFDLLASDTFGLLRALGRECAGAIVVQPAGDDPPPEPSTLAAEPLDDDQLQALVANLRNAPLGTSARVRVSLAGVQEKLVLTRMPGGRWGSPVDGAPSTHILKPELAEYPATVANEAFCMRTARHLGLPAAHVETTSVGGRPLLVVERFDREVAADGTVVRLHQEDLAQATGIPPEKKYQTDGGPSLARIAGVLQSVAAPGAREALLRMVTLNVVVGNGDAHAKNFSLLHHPAGTVDLAPAYDVLSTLQYGDDSLAMYVDDLRRTDRVTGARLLNEAVAWGLGRDRAMQVVTVLLDGLPEATARAREETDNVPDDLGRLVDAQAERLRRTS